MVPVDTTVSESKRERTPDPNCRTKREHNEGIWWYRWVGTDILGTEKETEDSNG